MRKVERKNRKATDGLTSEGISVHIASSLRCFHHGKGTANDCQLTINPLVRAYHKTIIKERKIKIPATPLAKQARAEKKKAIKEHAVPAHEVVCRLMEIDPRRENFDGLVAKALDDTFHVAWVVPDEHDRLNSVHMHSLPVKRGATLKQLAELRYKKAEVDLPCLD